MSKANPVESAAPVEATSAMPIGLCMPEIRGNEWKYVKDCLDTNWVSSVGPYVDRFEADMTRYVGTKHAVATVTGTAALHTALLVAGVKPDDEVLVSTLTFIAPVNAIRYVGAWPLFIDAEPMYWQMDANQIADFLDKGCVWVDGTVRNKSTGRRVKAILPVHILGHPVDMDPILGLARKFGLVVIEDATEGLGAKYRGRKVGHLGDIGCFSFNGNKIITTGGGGMIVTDNGAWAAKAKHLTTQAKDDPTEFIHGEIGYNYRLTNLQAAVGCAQLELIEAYIASKRLIAARYTENLGVVPGLTPMQEAPWASSTFWMFTLLVDRACYGQDARSLLRLLAANRIQARPLWQPSHRSPAHHYCGTSNCPVSEHLNSVAISLPCSVGLTSPAQKKVIELIAAANTR